MTTLRTFWWTLSAGSGLALTFAACSDSLHLDPPGSTSAGTGGSSATTSSSSGGHGGHPDAGPPSGCVSNAECAYPKAVCDTATGKCVQCLFDSSCTEEPGTVCSKGSCICPITGQSICPAVAPAPGYCADLTTSQTDCGTCGRACFGGCAAGKCVDPWLPTSLTGAPTPRSHHVAVWTGSQMIVWGGRDPGGPTSTGGIYDPVKNTWTATNVVNAPSPRQNATAVWTGTAMIVWGGLGNGPLSDGARFDPVKNIWTTLSNNGPPSARYQHTSVWDGKHMLVWGGYDGTAPTSTGEIYDPVSDAWTTLGAGSSPPSPRSQHSAIWVGGTANEMVVFGGLGIGPPPMLTDGTILGDCAGYAPSDDSWATIDTSQNAPEPRIGHSAVFGEGVLFVWGGFDDASTYYNDGAFLNLTNGWSFMNPPSPPPRAWHTAVWIPKGATGGGMFIWGGESAAGGHLGDGAVFSGPATNAWSKPLPTAPVGRSHHTAVLTSDTPPRMLIWGGDTDAGLTNSGAILDPTKFLP